MSLNLSKKIIQLDPTFGRLTVPRQLSSQTFGPFALSDSNRIHGFAICKAAAVLTIYQGSQGVYPVADVIDIAATSGYSFSAEHPQLSNSGQKIADIAIVAPECYIEVTCTGDITDFFILLQRITI